MKTTRNERELFTRNWEPSFQKSCTEVLYCVATTSRAKKKNETINKSFAVRARTEAICFTTMAQWMVHCVRPSPCVIYIRSPSDPVYRWQHLNNIMPFVHEKKAQRCWNVIKAKNASRPTNTDSTHLYSQPNRIYYKHVDSEVTVWSCLFTADFTFSFTIFRNVQNGTSWYVLIHVLIVHHHQQQQQQ